jgi:predicted transcriptional regulator
MNDVQIIRSADGAPAFAVLPYDQYERLSSGRSAAYIPQAVVGKMVDGASAVRAWREHLGLTQAEVAARMNISQAAYSQLEASPKLRHSSRCRIAAALGLDETQLVRKRGG